MSVCLCVCAFFFLCAYDRSCMCAAVDFKCPFIPLLLPCCQTMLVRCVTQVACCFGERDLVDRAFAVLFLLLIASRLLRQTSLFWFCLFFFVVTLT